MGNSYQTLSRRHRIILPALPGGRAREHTYLVHSDLISWYRENARPLPWRTLGVSAWAILVCEVMSQQTPISRVLPAWKEWMDRWPNPQALAAASPAEVILAWGSLGYPRRGLRLRECAIAVVDEWGGELPRSRSDLLTLPGVGPYTADAVVAFAFREPATVLDVNVRRVLARLDGEEFPPDSLRKWEIARAEKLVPTDGEESAEWNAAIMEFGALICKARNPQCATCPISSKCGWFAAGKPPHTKPRKVQSFAGTHREARGKIMKVLREGSEAITLEELQAATGLTSERFGPAYDSLIADGLAATTPSGISLPRTIE